MICYKLTESDFTTKNNTLWGNGVEHTARGAGDLCTSGWLHFYTDPYIAAFRNPADANFINPILWEAEASGEILHERFKSGCSRLKTIRQIPLPEISMNARIRVAIKCAMLVYQDESFIAWANNWLSNKDRSAYAASAAASAAASVAAYAANAAAYAAAAAAAAAYAAYAAAHAANTAAYAANAAAYAAAAAAAAAYAAYADRAFDLVEIIKEAIREEASL